MKTVILTKADKNNDLKCLLTWWRKSLLEHLLTNLLCFKVPQDIFVVGIEDEDLGNILEKYHIYKKNYIILKEQGTEIDSLLKVKPILGDEKFISVIDSNSFFPKKDIRRMVEQEDLNYPMIFTYDYKFPYSIIKSDGRDATVKTILDFPEMVVNTGAYILPKDIWGVLRKLDFITEALLQLKINAGMKIYTFNVHEWRYFHKAGDFVE